MARRGISLIRLCGKKVHFPEDAKITFLHEECIKYRIHPIGMRTNDLEDPQDFADLQDLESREFGNIMLPDTAEEGYFAGRTIYFPLMSRFVVFPSDPSGNEFYPDFMVIESDHMDQLTEEVIVKKTYKIVRRDPERVDSPEEERMI